MTRYRTSLLLSLLGFAAFALSGCQTRCQELNGILVDRYEECGELLTEDLEDGGGRIWDCGITEEAHACAQACVEEATCEELVGSDPDATEYFECRAACP